MITELPPKLQWVTYFEYRVKNTEQGSVLDLPQAQKENNSTLLVLSEKGEKDAG